MATNETFVFYPHNPDFNVTVPKSINPFYTTIEVFIAVAAIIDNSLVVVVYAKNSRLRTITNSYVLSLAIADLLVAIVGIPSAALTAVGLPRNFNACLFTNSLLLVLCTGSILALMAVTVDRFCAVVYPFRYQRLMTRKRGITINVVFWVLAMVVGFLPLMGWNLGPPPAPRCFFMEVIDLRYLAFVYVVTLIGPMIFMAGAYIKIYMVVRHQMRRTPQYTNSSSLSSSSASRSVRSTSSLGRSTRKPELSGRKPERSAHKSERSGLDSSLKAGSDSGASLHSKSSRHGEHRAISSAEGRAALRLAIVVLVFIMSWFPLYTFNFAMYVCKEYRRSCPVHDYWIKAAVVLSHLNSAWNPVLYAWAMTDFMDAVKSLFGFETDRQRMRVCQI